VISFLGVIVFATIVGIGVLDRNSGLSLFAMYRSARAGWPPPAGTVSERRRGENRPEPPAPGR
jgi:hypothetical protein